MRDVRDALTEIDAVSRELQSLKTILELLADDLNACTHLLPLHLEEQISSVLYSCGRVVVQVQACIESHDGPPLQKGVMWAAMGKAEMQRLRGPIEVHKTSLSLALDLIHLYVP